MVKIKPYGKKGHYWTEYDSEYMNALKTVRTCDEGYEIRQPKRITCKCGKQVKLYRLCTNEFEYKHCNNEYCILPFFRCNWCFIEKQRTAEGIFKDIKNFYCACGKKLKIQSLSATHCFVCCERCNIQYEIVKNDEV